MTEKIKQHFMRRKFHYLLPMLVVAISIGVYLSLFGINNVLAVSGVTLTDNDTTGYGLDGRDFTVSWTPGVAPAGYGSTYIYITSSTASTTLSLANFNVNGCNGSPCLARGQLLFHADSSWILPNFFTTDSAGETFTTGTAYTAYIFTSSTIPTLVSSTVALTYTNANYDSPTDTNSPFVDHMSNNSAAAGVAAIMYAGVDDDQTASSTFGILNDAGAEFIELVYGADVSASRATSTGSFVTGTVNLFKFTVPAAVVGNIGNTFEYYIMVQDRAGNV